jgi:prepilin-type N-terminal cleavage/methylation domain-containing protein
MTIEDADGKDMIKPRLPNPGEKGLTLIELLVTTAIMSILVFTVGYTFIVALKLWNEGYARADIRTDLAQAFELVGKNLRQAKSIDALTASSVTFTADLGGGDTSCRIYLYSSSDAEPNPPYSAGSYELRWAQGTTTYGAGTIWATDIAQPTTAPFSQSGSLITMDMTVTRGDESLRMRTNVRPRTL